MAGRFRSFVDWANTELAKLPGVPFKTVHLATLDYGTLAWAVTLSFVKDSADAVPVFNAWLYALCAFHGVNLGAFIMAKVKGPGANAPMPADTSEYPVVPPSPPEPIPVATVATTTVVTTPAASSPPTASGVMQ